MDPVEHVPCRSVLKACVAGGDVKLLEYCIRRHEPTDGELEEALIYAATLGLGNIIGVLLRHMSDEPPPDLAERLMKIAIAHMHLPLLESIQSLGRSRVSPFACYSIQYPEAEEFWPAARALLVYLLRQVLQTHVWHHPSQLTEIIQLKFRAATLGPQSSR